MQKFHQISGMECIGIHIVYYIRWRLLALFPLKSPSASLNVNFPTVFGPHVTFMPAWLVPEICSSCKKDHCSHMFWMHFLLFLESKITYITNKMWQQKFLVYFRDVCRLGWNQLETAFCPNQGSSPPLHFIITLINAMLLLCIIKEPYTNYNHQNYFVMEVYRVLIKMFLFSSM